MDPGYRIRPMAREEIALAIEWAANEGWNPGLHDAACFHAADPGGFLVGLLDGEPVACISVVKYAADFGFLGFYIVKPGYRGRGLGLAIWNAGMARLAGRTVGLDGVIAQQENYRKSGFSLAWRNVRHEGEASAAAATSPFIVPAAGLPFETIRQYDAAFFPADRSTFLRGWIEQPGSSTLAWVEQGRLRGYGTIRPCRAGFKIGPLFADDATVADALFDALADGVPQGDKIYLDTPQTNPAAVALAQRHGMRAVFETARMYTRTAPQTPIGRLYGVTSFELG